ncbi:hornerin-like [Monodelphis domestica]|uniref:hornerin-like n=1 Tax=Monodelphis domestica TaxID=13616 RepID=UPI0024E2740D|nr:hornerin-like [Monodelphis domestica]
MSQLLTRIATIIDVFNQYCGQDKECDMISQQELKEFLENELQFIVQNSEDSEAVDVIMLNMDLDQSGRGHLTDLVFQIIKKILLMKKCNKKESSQGNSYHMEEIEKEEKRWRKDLMRSNWNQKEEYGPRRSKYSLETEKVRYRLHGEEERKDSVSSSDEEKDSEKKNYTSNSSKAGNNKGDEKTVSRKQGWRIKKESERPSKKSGGEKRETDYERSSKQEGERKKQDMKSTVGNNESNKRGQTVRFESEEKQRTCQEKTNIYRRNYAMGKNENCDIETNDSNKFSESKQIGSGSGKSYNSKRHGTTSGKESETCETKKGSSSGHQSSKSSQYSFPYINGTYSDSGSDSECGTCSDYRNDTGTSKSSSSNQYGSQSGHSSSTKGHKSSSGKKASSMGGRGYNSSSPSAQTHSSGPGSGSGSDSGSGTDSDSGSGSESCSCSGSESGSGHSSGSL